MGSLEQVLPCGLDVWRVSVVGGLVDQEAEIEVAGLVRVLIVELAQPISRISRKA